MEAWTRELGGNGLSEPGTDYGAWELDLETLTAVWSAHVYRIHGVEEGEFDPGSLKAIAELVHPDDLEAFQRSCTNTIETRRPVPLQYRIIRPDGEERTLLSRGAFIPGEGTRPDRITGTTEDITGRLSHEDRLWQLANRDPLTGLFNRRRFREELAREAAFSLRSGKRGALLIFDIDNFKDINDTLGHPAGDKLLSRMGRHLNTLKRRSTDTLARLGGDEFALILPGCDITNAERLAETLLRDLDEGTRVNGRARPVTAGVGIAEFGPGVERSAEELLVEADLALYRAKAIGPASIEVFDEELRGQLAGRMEIEVELREALDRDQLTLHYQPIASLPDGVAIGCEALLRWNHPTRGLVPPADFISVAEESGLILPIGRWVLERACSQAEAWRRRGRHLHVSVNVSPVQLLRDDVAEVVARTLAETGLPPQLLYLEVTESSLIEDAGRIAGGLQRLRDMGVKIAIDDFGGGSSSLSYLSVLPVDEIKIDRLFVKGLPGSSDDRAIISAVISLAEELDITVVAEGIETDQQHWELRELGCRLGQGFLYSRPRPAAELELDGFSTAVQPGVGDPSTIREFMRQIGIPARVAG